MKETKVTLVRLIEDDREQFILDNQWAFKHGAMPELGERDNHIDEVGEIISRKTIEGCIDDPQNETYRIVCEGRRVGGAIHIAEAVQYRSLDRKYWRRGTD